MRQARFLLVVAAVGLLCLSSSHADHSISELGSFSVHPVAGHDNCQITGVTVSTSGNIVVAVRHITDTPVRTVLLVMDEAGTILQTKDMTTPFGVGYVSQISIAPNGELYAVDQSSHRVHVLSQSLNEIRAWPADSVAGSTEGDFNAPTGVAINADGTKVVVLDKGNVRISALSPEGAHIQSFSAGSGSMKAIAVSPDNFVYSSVNGGLYVRKQTITGSLIEDIAVSDNRVLYGVTVDTVTNNFFGWRREDTTTNSSIIIINSTGTIQSNTATPAQSGTNESVAVDSRKMLLYATDEVAKILRRYTFNTSPNIAATPSPTDGFVSADYSQDIAWGALSDPDGDSLSADVYFGDVNPPPFVTNTVATTYDPGPLVGKTYYWRIDSKDVYGARTTGTVWSFSLPNRAPVATAGSATTDEGVGVAITLPATDADGNSLTYSVVSGPTNGSASAGAAANRTYTPNGGFTGADSFTFKANDGALDSNTETFSLTVNSVAQYITATDHGGADWTLANGDVVASTHTNVGVFTIPAGATVTVKGWNGADYGMFVLHAQTITISGTLIADGTGYRGGMRSGAVGLTARTPEGPGGGYQDPALTNAAAEPGGAGYGGAGGDTGVGGAYGGNSATANTAHPFKGFQMGSGGGGGRIVSDSDHSRDIGGNGGGAVILYANYAITLSTSSKIWASGTTGVSVSSNGVVSSTVFKSGGGSGGCVELISENGNVTVNGSVLVNGGATGNTDGISRAFLGSGGELFFQGRTVTINFTGGISSVTASGGPHTFSADVAGGGGRIHAGYYSQNITSAPYAGQGRGSSMGETVLNLRPPAPTSLAQVRSDDGSSIPFGNWTNNLTPISSFTLSNEPAGSNVRFRIQISTDSNFGNSQYTSHMTNLALSRSDDFTSIMLPEGTTNYNFPTLTNGGTYYWRTLVIDSFTATSDWALANAGQPAVKIDTHPPTGHSVASFSVHLSSITINLSAAGDALSGFPSEPYALRWSTSPNFETSISTTSAFFGGLSTQTAALAINTNYHFRVKARDNASNEAFSAAQPKATLCDLPPSPQILAVFSSSISLTVNTGNNPFWTEFAVKVASGAVEQFVQTAGGIDAVEVFRDTMTWGALWITGLTGNTTHVISVSARNLDSVKTAYSLSATTITRAAVPSISGFSGVGITSMTISWTPNNPAPVDFYLEGSSLTDVSPASITSGWTLGTSSSVFALLGNTTYYWRVRARNSIGLVTNFSGISSAFTGNNSPGQVSGPGPAHLASVSTSSPTLSWAASVDPDGDAVTYTVFLSTASGNLGAAVSSQQSAVSYAASNLTYGVTYYWRVDARDAPGATVQGTLWQFFTAGSAPSAPTYSGGQGELTATNRKLTLAWDMIDLENDPLTYTVFFATFSPPTISTATGLTSAAWETGVLGYSTTYYWRIEGRDPLGNATLGAVQSFRIINRSPSGMDMSGSPYGALSTREEELLLFWQGGEDPDGDTITYELLLGGELTSVSNALNWFAPKDASPRIIYEGQDKSMLLKGLVFGKSYTYQVKSKDAFGGIVAGPWLSFVIAPPIPKPYNFPNPFRPGTEDTTFAFEMPAEGSATLDVFTEFHDRVFSITGTNLSKGFNSVTWDGRDEKGSLIFSGTYIARLTLETTAGKKIHKVYMLAIK